MKKLVVLLLLTLAAVTLAGCQRDSEVASYNLSQESDAFQIPRRIVFYNGITDQYIAVMTGYCSIKDAPNLVDTISVICKTPDGYKKNYMHMSNNMTYVSEQLSPAQVSAMHYELLFKPASVVPSVKVETSTP